MSGAGEKDTRTHRQRKKDLKEEGRPVGPGAETYRQRKDDRTELYQKNLDKKMRDKKDVWFPVMIDRTPDGMECTYVYLTKAPDGSTAPDGCEHWTEAEAMRCACEAAEAEIQEKHGRWGELQEEIDEHTRFISAWESRVTELQEKLQKAKEALSAAKEMQRPLETPPPNFVYGGRRREFIITMGKPRDGGKKKTVRNA